MSRNFRNRLDDPYYARALEPSRPTLAKEEFFPPQADWPGLKALRVITLYLRLKFEHFKKKFHTRKNVRS